MNDSILRQRAITAYAKWVLSRDLGTAMYAMAASVGDDALIAQAIKQERERIENQPTTDTGDSGTGDS